MYIWDVTCYATGNNKLKVPRSGFSWQYCYLWILCLLSALNRICFFILVIIFWKDAELHQETEESSANHVTSKAQSQCSASGNRDSSPWSNPTLKYQGLHLFWLSDSWERAWLSLAPYVASYSTLGLGQAKHPGAVSILTLRQPRNKEYRRGRSQGQDTPKGHIPMT